MLPLFEPLQLMFTLASVAETVVGSLITCVATDVVHTGTVLPMAAAITDIVYEPGARFVNEPVELVWSNPPAVRTARYVYVREPASACVPPVGDVTEMLPLFDALQLMFTFASVAETADGSLIAIVDTMRSHVGVMPLPIT